MADCNKHYHFFFVVYLVFVTKSQILDSAFDNKGRVV